MAHSARQRPWATWCAALFLCSLIARGQGRFLAELKDAFLDVPEIASSAAESNAGDSQFESTPILVTGSVLVSPFSWLQQQLGIFAALEQAVVQRFNEGLTPYTSPRASTQSDLLRHVGCARMRAALLNKAAQQGSGMGMMMRDGDDSVSDAAGGYGYMDGEEYIEDYSGGSVSSRAAYAVGDARLRGASTDTAAASEAAAAETSGSSSLASQSESRILRSEGYYGFYQDGYYSGDDDGAIGDSYEYEYEYYDDEEAEEENSAAGVMRGKAKAQQDMAGLPNKDSLEGPILQLLESAFSLAYGSRDAATTSQDAAAKVSAAETSPAASAASTTAVTATADAAADTAAGSAVDFGYDSYDLLDKADMLAGISSVDEDDLLFGYEDNLYEDYYQAMSLANVMLSQLDIDRTEEEWADYLEKAYEYFAFYMDDGDEYISTYGSSSSLSSLYSSAASGSTYPDGPSSALEALASIAELVVWAHMGNFVLEVRPTLTISQVSQDGAVVESGSVFLISGEPYGFDDGAAAGNIATIDDGYAAAVLAIGDDLLLAEKRQQLLVEDVAPLKITNDLSLRWMMPDGSVNWGLVTMVILAVGTAAMLVGFVASWMALRRSMKMTAPVQQGSWVFVPQRGKRCGKGYDDGYCDYGAPLMLRAEDCKGAVCWGGAVAAVEDAAEYVSPKLANESVAKALYK